MADKQIQIRLWRSSWLKLLICLKSVDTQIDPLGSHSFVYEHHKDGRIMKGTDGQYIKKCDKGGRPLKVKTDYDPSIAFWTVVEHIEKQLKQQTI